MMAMMMMMMIYDYLITTKVTLAYNRLMRSRDIRALIAQLQQWQY